MRHLFSMFPLILGGFPLRCHLKMKESLAGYAFLQWTTKFRCKISCRWRFWLFFQMTNWVGLIVCQKINETMMLLHTKFERNPIHIFQYMMKMRFHSMLEFTMESLCMPVSQRINISLRNLCKCRFRTCHTFFHYFLNVIQNSSPFLTANFVFWTWGLTFFSWSTSIKCY